MDQKSVIFPVDKEVAHPAHAHFYDYIQSFHGLEDQPNYPDQQAAINEKLRQQYLYDNNWDQKLCYRTCFKLRTKDYVQFCLDNKCGGADFNRAAQVMGYVKN